MKFTTDKKRIAALLVMMVALFVIALLISSLVTYKSKRANEKLDNVDTYKMESYSETNSAKVMKALASGKSKKLSKLMVSSEGADELMDFADWKNADFKNAVSLGSGSLMKAPDKNGKMEVDERFFVDVDGQKYVLFIESSTSRWGRKNDGVSAIAATTYDHFDEMDYEWNGEPDDESVLAGNLIWNSGSDKDEE